MLDSVFKEYTELVTVKENLHEHRVDIACETLVEKLQLATRRFRSG